MARPKREDVLSSTAQIFSEPVPLTYTKVDSNVNVLVLYNEESSSLKQDALTIANKSVTGGVLAISANTARAIHNGSMHIIRIK